MIKFINYQKEELLALAEISTSFTNAGEKTLSGTIYSNNAVLFGIDRGWSLEFGGEVYFITYAKPSDKGNSVSVEFDAIHEFFYKFGKSSVYEVLSDGSHTAKTYLDLIFGGSEYDYVLSVNATAFEKQGFGLNTRLSLFNDFITTTNLEFSIDKKEITISEKNGRDLSTIVRKGFNLQELGLEFEIGDFVTYCKGFGAYKDEEDHSKGRLEAEYLSPLSKIYGKLEAAPFSDERYTVVENLTSKIKELVDNSFSVSVSLTIQELKESGYDYKFPTPGDYIMAVDEELLFSQKVRIVKVEIDYDIFGNVVKSDVTCGSVSSVDRMNDTNGEFSAVIERVVNGDGKFPYDWLHSAVTLATEALRDTQTELKYSTNGLMAIDKKNRNNIVILNSAGIGVSTDGGKTYANAMTGAGINATTILVGILSGILVQGNVIKSIGDSSYYQSVMSNGKFMIEQYKKTDSVDYSNPNWEDSVHGAKVGGYVGTYNSSTKKANGSALINYPGYIFSINQDDGKGASLPIFQVPSDATIDKLKYNLFGAGTFEGDIKIKGSLEADSLKVNGRIDAKEIYINGEKVIPGQSGGGGGGGTGGYPPEVTTDADKFAWDAWFWLINNGYSKQAAAGILGNIQGEAGSSMNPDIDQIGGPGYGIVQWDGSAYPLIGPPTWDGREYVQRLMAAAGISTDYKTMEAQIRLVNWCMYNGQWIGAVDPTSVEGFKNSTDPKQAAYAFEKNFERPATAHSERQVYAQTWYDKFKDLKPSQNTGEKGLEHLKAILGQRIGNGQCYGLSAEYSGFLGGCGLGAGTQYGLSHVSGNGSTSAAADIGIAYNWSEVGWKVIKNPEYKDLVVGAIMNYARGGHVGSWYADDTYGHTGIIRGLENGKIQTYEQNTEKGQICAELEREFYSPSDISSICIPPN
jgi:hypothetical protein